MLLVTESTTPSQNTQSPTGTSSTPSQTFTPSSTPTETPTTTLVPLPALTLVFPAPTNTPEATLTPAIVSNADAAKPSEDGEVAKLSPRLRILAILLVFLWLFLVGFVIIYIRQFR
jgi:hypothetical protein